MLDHIIVIVLGNSKTQIKLFSPANQINGTE